LKEVVWVSFLIIIISSILPYLLTIFLESDLQRFLLVGFTCVITVSASIYFLGIDSATKNMVVQKIKTTIQQFKIWK